MKEETEEVFEQEKNYSRDFDSNYLDADPVRYPTEIDSQLIKSGYKQNEFTIKIPIFAEEIVWEVERDKTGRIKLLNGKPVKKSLKKVKFFTGKYEKKAFPLPIDLHNDSVTTSILENTELSLIRMIDSFCYDLSLEDVSDPETDYSTSLALFSGIKASIVESSKGKGGRMAELAKTSINKGESKNYDYRQSNELDEYNARKKRKGLLGWGHFGL